MCVTLCNLKKKKKCFYAKFIGLNDKCLKLNQYFFLPTRQIYLVIFFFFYPDGPSIKMRMKSKFYFHVPFNNVSTPKNKFTLKEKY